ALWRDAPVVLQRDQAAIPLQDARGGTGRGVRAPRPRDLGGEHAGISRPAQLPLPGARTRSVSLRILGGGRRARLSRDASVLAGALPICLRELAPRGRTAQRRSSVRTARPLRRREHAG